MEEREDKKYGLRDIYKFYKSEVLSELQVSPQEFSKITGLFNRELISTILYDSSEVRLPANMGDLRIKKRELNLSKKNSLTPNWKATNKLWEESPKAKEEKKLVYHLNESRGGYRYKIYWDKSASKNRHKSLYYFKPARTFSRELAYILQTLPEIEYYT